MVGLCFGSLRDCFSEGSGWAGGGDPILSRASDLTALVALNFFFLFRGAICLVHLPGR